MTSRNFSENPPSEAEKLWLVKEIHLYGETASKLSQKYGVARRPLIRWVEASRKCGILRQSAGQSRILTAALRANIVAEMTGNVFEKTVEEFESIVQAGHIKDVMSYSTTPMIQIAKVYGINLIASRSGSSIGSLHYIATF